MERRKKKQGYRVKSGTLQSEASLDKTLTLDKSQASLVLYSLNRVFVPLSDNLAFLASEHQLLTFLLVLFFASRQRKRTSKKNIYMEKKRLIELTVKMIVAALTAFLTAVTTTSCMGHGPIYL